MNRKKNGKTKYSENTRNSYVLRLYKVQVMGTCITGHLFPALEKSY